jgi:hypothetical protein
MGIDEPTSRVSTRSILLAVVILVVGLGAVIWAIQLSQQPGAGPTSSNPDIPRVSMAEAKTAWEDGTAVFVDVRGKTVYDSAHIPGAISIPLDSVQQQLDSLDPGAWIIPYCT